MAGAVAEAVTQSHTKRKKKSGWPGELFYFPHFCQSPKKYFSLILHNNTIIFAFWIIKIGPLVPEILIFENIDFHINRMKISTISITKLFILLCVYVCMSTNVCPLTNISEYLGNCPKFHHEIFIEASYRSKVFFKNTHLRKSNRWGSNRSSKIFP